jgi:catechol 2,3-dioxygenase-like lactoylglutathione lyase family enzyme
MKTHLRVARATDNLDEILHFYGDGLGFEVVGEFHDHEGFDGVMLGHAGYPYHFEFTRERGVPAGRAPNAESLLVFYLPEREAWESAVGQMEALGIAAVKAHNPYWDRCGKTYEDADGYRIVLCQNGWENRPLVPG